MKTKDSVKKYWFSNAPFRQEAYVAFEDYEEVADYCDRLVDFLPCLPKDVDNLREANGRFAIENERLRNRLYRLGECPDCEQEVDHWVNEPFASCGCGQSEDCSGPSIVQELRSKISDLEGREENLCARNYDLGQYNKSLTDKVQELEEENGKLKIKIVAYEVQVPLLVEDKKILDRKLNEEECKNTYLRLGGQADEKILKEEIKVLKTELVSLEKEKQHYISILKEHAKAASIFQSDGKYNKEANLRLGDSCVVEGIKWLDMSLEGYKQKWEEASRRNKVLEHELSMCVIGRNAAAKSWETNENKVKYFKLALADSQMEAKALEQEIGGWKKKWECAVEMAAIAQNKLDNIKNSL